MRNFDSILNSFKKVAKKAAKVSKKPVSEIAPTDFFAVAGKDITEWEIRKNGGFQKFLELAAVREEPHPLVDFTKEAIGSIIKKNDYKDGTFFITAVAPTSYVDWSEDEIKQASQGKDVVGSNLHEEAFAAVKNFLKREKAELVLLPMPAHVKALHSQPKHYDPKLKPYLKNFATEYTFNNHLKAIEAYINPQQINPLTGLKRLRIHKYGENSKPGEEMKRFKTSIIVAHSKQMMEAIPTGNSTHPRIIHSTGAITKPAYLRNRIGMIANEDHKLGGLIIQIEGDIFHIRQVQFDEKDGSFVDLATRYHADGSVEYERAEAFKMGDIHPGFHDQKLLDAMYDLWGVIRPKKIFYEDAFDGLSISHHLVTKNITRSQRPEYFSSLEKEIEMARGVLKETFENAPKDAIKYMTAANHPDHVMRYLNEGRYIKDDVNFAIGHRMVVMTLDGKNPLKEYLDPENNMVWTDENDDIFVEGVQMNSHGHLGVNGSRSGKAGQELAFGSAMVAHSHTPGIYHDLFTVGHMTVPRHGYNNGPGTWIPACGAVYKRGQKQLYIFMQNKFESEKNSKMRKQKRKKK